MDNLRVAARKDPDDDDGDGGRDYNHFHWFKIRLGSDGGKEGTRAWDVLKKAWAAREARQRAEKGPAKKPFKKPVGKAVRRLAGKKKRGP